MADLGLVEQAKQGLEHILLLTAVSGGTMAIAFKGYDLVKGAYKSAYRRIYRTKNNL